MRLLAYIPAPVPALTLAALVLSACAGGFSFRRAQPTDPSVQVVEGPGAEVIRPEARPGIQAGAHPGSRPGSRATAALQPRGRTAESLDSTSAAERTAATEAAARAQGRALGETLAGLGSPTEPGFWLLTGLVDRARPGRVTAPSGAAVAVELRPSGGPAAGGSQISLAAIRALGLPLTDLSTLRVFALD